MADPSEVYFTFGKYGPHKGDHRTVEECPSSYLRWVSGYTDTEYINPDLFEAIEEELARRDRSYSHWEE